jgi:hypothetical protein
MIGGYKGKLMEFKEGIVAKQDKLNSKKKCEF